MVMVKMVSKKLKPRALEIERGHWEEIWWSRQKRD